MGKVYLKHVHADISLMNCTIVSSFSTCIYYLDVKIELHQFIQLYLCCCFLFMRFKTFKSLYWDNVYI